ncbi:hypothetical protein AXG93_3384s2060 [Marchantia polymorpha subsp. ruderalis]|uniref:F-box domain-containing protein n=1 Tax=Marchantia polymorpha subsp. ruderalis TaxID=1480154 RepID=A0A176WEU4_MARPO|nr:hypothetical protein AXG93_3384s2060 [Marchantia polymorpha subsp. ruderalis]
MGPAVNSHGPGIGVSASLELLPIEILTRILSLIRTHDLTRAAQACKALSDACDRVIGTLTHLDLKNVGANLDDFTFSKLSKKLGPNLKSLDVDCWHLSEDSLKNLPKGLEELALCGCDLHTSRIISNVIDSTRGSLRRFAWSGFGCTPSAGAFERLLFNSPNLTSFRIDSLIQNIDVNVVVRAMADLCPFVNDLSAFDLTMETFSYIKQRGTQLKKLRHKRTLGSSMGITDASLVTITLMCPSLEELNLVDECFLPTGVENFLTDTGLLVLAERAATLRKLKLKLARPEVAELCSEVAVMELASLCGKLTHVELINFKRLSDPPAYELIQLTSRGLRALELCGSLEVLNAGSASGFSDSVISTICSGNPNLKILLYLCKAVLTTPSGNIKLEDTLVLSFAPLTDNALKHISMCHHMQGLAIHECNRITNVGLNVIAKGYCERITDAGVIALAEGCSQLMKVQLDGCKLLSNPCVRALCQKAPRLRYLSMNQCPKLSDDVFQHLLDGASLRFIVLGSPKLSTENTMAFHLKRQLVELLIDGKRCVTSPTNSPELNNELISYLWIYMGGLVDINLVLLERMMYGIRPGIRRLEDLQETPRALDLLPSVMEALTQGSLWDYG